MGWGTCHGKGHAAGDGTGFGGQGCPWVPKSSRTSSCVGSALAGHEAPQDWEPLAVGAAPLSCLMRTHLPSHLVSPLVPPGAPSSPSRFPGTAIHFSDGKRAPALPPHLKKKTQTQPKPREERNKQTNPFPLLAWHLLAALPLLIREAAGVISNKPLLMKFRAADPGGAPRHRFSETLIKFTA